MLVRNYYPWLLLVGLWAYWLWRPSLYVGYWQRMVGPGDATGQALADTAVPPDRAAAWTHALMDVGARLCSPRNPRCGECPAVAWCRFAAGERPAASKAPRGSRRPAPAFATTSRWLRGRVLERAREAPNGAWIEYPDVLGVHETAAVREAVLALASEGLLEARDGPAGIEARLPS